MMNFTPNNIPVVPQQSPVLYSHDQSFQPQPQWNNLNNRQSNNLPLQLSQYYNVFPEVPSTKTSWTFPNGCITSSIVRFTGTPSPMPPPAFVPTDQLKFNNVLPMKRKSLTDENEIQPNKMFITEDKMAARMNGMHISNDFVSYSSTSNETNAEDDSEMKNNLQDYSDTKRDEPQLVVCDELKNLNEQINNCLIPESLIPLEKPLTAVVLWRPPMAYLNVVNSSEEEYPMHSSVIITDITDRPDLDNNNLSNVSNLNVTTSVVEYPQDTMETMEI